MRLHLATITDSSLKFLENSYKAPIGRLTMEHITKKKNHNIMMIDIASTLNYAEFDEIKDCTTTHGMWTKKKEIYGGNYNVRRAKGESRRG